MDTIQKFNYQNQEIEFNLKGKNVMVNATEMAKLFGKQVNEFLTNSSTKLFIDACLKNGNSRYIAVQDVQDLYVSNQKSGTWMHRILALKFAAWLDPDFEVWVYFTIDELLFGNMKQRDIALRDKTLKELKILSLENKLQADLAANEDYKLLQKLKGEAKELTKSLRKLDKTHIENQLELWISE